jgi:hypothetical protein
LSVILDATREARRIGDPALKEPKAQYCKVSFALDPRPSTRLLPRSAEDDVINFFSGVTTRIDSSRSCFGEASLGQG